MYHVHCSLKTEGSWGYNVPNMLTKVQLSLVLPCYSASRHKRVQPLGLAARNTAWRLLLSHRRPKAFPSRARWEVFGAGLGRVFCHSERYKHGNESSRHIVKINDLWQISTNLHVLHDCLGPTFPICHERFAFSLDVHATTR